MSYEPVQGTIPCRAVAVLREHPEWNPCTSELCDALGIETEAFTAYMRPAREHGLVHTRREGRVLRWRVGNGTPDPGLELAYKPRATELLTNFKPEAALPPAPPPNFRALVFEGKLLVTGMEVKEGVAIFTPQMLQLMAEAARRNA